MEESPVIYGLEFQARALAPQVSEGERIRFLVGTQSLKAENQVHLIDFDDENNVVNKTVLLHRVGEVWHISSSTFDKKLLATCYNHIASDSKSELRAAVWKLPRTSDPGVLDDSTTFQPLELACHLNSTAEPADIKCVLWHPNGDSHSVVGIADSHILLWDLDADVTTAQLSNSTSVEVKGHLKLSCGRWNPHHNCNQVATANDTTIRGWDLRTMQQVYVIEMAHGQLVRDLDFNPNKQYYMATCGDDCKVKFWDIRNVTQPLKVLADHSHWVWAVRYNHFHDQLVLSSSSDSHVVLNDVVSLSSEPFGHLLDEDDSDEYNRKETEGKSADPPVDSLVCTYEEHEDSVYAVEWSTTDPWLFVSLSYDGRLVVNRVPRAQKYKILL